MQATLQANTALPTVEDHGIELRHQIEDEILQRAPLGFSISDEGTANFVVTLIAEARARADRAAMWAERIKARSRHEEAHLRFRFEGQLRLWVEGELRRLKGRRKSIALPGGIVGFRSVPARLSIKDEPLAMRWARQSCPTAIVVSERLLKTPLNEHFAKTGEVPEGSEVIAPHMDFFVR